MKGDFSRQTFAPDNHYASVLMQQGRVQVDADWNEQAAIERYRAETLATDVVGSEGAPVLDAGFDISVEDGTHLLASGGRYYLDGLLCENPETVDYADQADFPEAPDALELLTAQNAQIGLVYLHAWRRHVTALEDPLLADAALQGADTTTRLKNVCQVKVLPIPSVQVSLPDALEDLVEERASARSALAQAIGQRDEAQIQQHSTRLVEIARDIAAHVPALRGSFGEWRDLTRVPRRSLTARARRPQGASQEPCLVSPDASYRGLENQLYRVEVHKGGPPGQATFKWSRDNGSVASAIRDMPGEALVIGGLPRDDIEGLASGQWVEVSDDTHDFLQQPGELIQIASVDLASRTVVLARRPTAIDLTRHPKLRRWDSAGELPLQVPLAEDGWIELEDGVEVRFQVDGVYRSGDYWLIPARCATGDVEWPPFSPGASPLPQQPGGVAQHFAPLAVIYRYKGVLSVLDDRRRLFTAAADARSLVYVGGDGQQALPGATLARPLEAGVVGSAGPVQGARVKFTANQGVLQGEGQSGRTLVVSTGLDGVASCTWQIERLAAGQSEVSDTPHVVQAIMVGDDGANFGQPVRFSASQGLASGVAYVVPDDLPELRPADTVQEAIDQLTRLRRGGGDPGVRILRTLLIQTGQPLLNDAEVALAALADGIRVVCDLPIDASTIKQSTCHLTLHVPVVVDQTSGGATVRDLVGYQPLVLNGDVGAQATAIQWRPRAEAARWFQQTLPPMFAVGDGRILAWLTLRGHYIWGADRQDQSLVYLDGDTFGRPRDATGIDANFPSGDGRRGGDFLMWFWIVQVVRLTGLTVQPTSVIGGGVTSQGSIVLSGLAPAGGVTVTLASNNAAVVVPASVVVPAGQSTATFQITTRAVSADVSATVTATLSGTSQTATLAVRAPAPSAVTLAPTDVVGGNASTMTITLSGTAPDGGMPVALSATPTGVVTFPNNPDGTARVTAGQTSVAVQVSSRGALARTLVNVRATIGTTTREAVLTVQPSVTLSAFTLNRTAVVVGDPVVGTVTLSGAAPAAATVVLSSSDPGLVAPPAQVVIASGQTSAQFTIETTRTTAQPITITATLAAISRTATLSVQAPATLSAVAITPGTIPVGDPVAGSVTLSAAPLSNVVVALTSSAPASASVPVNVTVPAGQTSAAFLGQTSQVTAQPVTVTAALSGVTRSATLVVAPPSVSTLTFNPTSVRGGGSVSGTVTLSRAAPAGGSVVNLSSGNSAVIVPSTVAVGAGQTTATFTATTQAVGSTVGVTVTATIGGVSRSGTISVTPADIANLSVNPSTVTSGNSTTGTVSLTGPAPAGGTSVSLGSSNSSLTGIPSAVTVGAGATAVNFTVTTTAIVSSATVTLSATLRGLTRSVNLTLGPKPKDTKESKDTKDTKDKDKEKDTKELAEKTTDEPQFAGPSEFETEEEEEFTTDKPVSPFITGPERPAVGDTVLAEPLAATAQPELTGLTLASLELRVGETVGASVSISGPAPAGGAQVAIACSDPQVVRVPSVVTLSEGESSAEFVLEVLDVGAPTTVILTARLGEIDHQVSATVQPTARLAGLMISPNVVQSGEAAQATVALMGQLPPQGVVLAVTSSDRAAHTPATIDVAEHSDSMTFEIRTESVRRRRDVTITVTLDDQVVAAALTIEPPPSSARARSRSSTATEPTTEPPPSPRRRSRRSTAARRGSGG